MIETFLLMLPAGSAAPLACYSPECGGTYSYEVALSTSDMNSADRKIRIDEKQTVSGPKEVYEYPAFCIEDECIGMERCASSDLICLISNDTPAVQIAIPLDIEERSNWNVNSVTFTRNAPKIGLSPKERIYLVTWNQENRAGSEKALAGYFYYSKCRGVLAFTAAWHDRIEVLKLANGEERGFGAKKCVFLNE